MLLSISISNLSHARSMYFKKIVVFAGASIPAPGCTTARFEKQISLKNAGEHLETCDRIEVKFS